MNNFTKPLVRSILVLVMALALVGSAVPSSTVQAQAGTISGTVDDSSGCFRYLDVRHFPYDQLAFTVPATDVYTISFNSKTIAEILNFYLYEGSFDPSQEHDQATFIDRGYSPPNEITPEKVITAELTEGTTYILATNNNQTFWSLEECETRTITYGGSYVLDTSGPVIMLDLDEVDDGPGKSRNAPGHDPNGPGNSENAPGHDPNGPGNSENAAGHSG